jgi:hypothetical protein
MAELAKNYHDDLQNQNIEPQENDERTTDIELALRTILAQQTLEAPESLLMNSLASEAHIQMALKHAKNNTATSMDGCPYELWKTLHQHYLEKSANNKVSFDINKTLTRAFRDIQEHGVEQGSSFALGWMCPIYKKKDRTKISNYRLGVPTVHHMSHMYGTVIRVPSTGPVGI